MAMQGDARPTVTFPAVGRHHPLTGTKLYRVVTEAHVCGVVWTTWPGTAMTRTRDCLSYDSSVLTITPRDLEV